MESVLNIAWAVMSCLGLVAGVVHYRARARHPQSMAVVMLAIATIALLAFPAISLSDDLHPLIFSSESLSKRDNPSSFSSCHGPVSTLPPALEACPRIELKNSGVKLARPRVERERSGFARMVSGRDPPRTV